VSEKMRKATKTVATWFGVVAGIAGVEHGYFEILQGNIKPDGLLIASIGAPCVPEEVWNACEPAMTVIPNFFITGIMAIIIGLLVVIWSAAIIHREHGGLVLILLSTALLLFGGGLFPPLIGIVGGIAGTKINKTIDAILVGNTWRLFARLWPWPLIVFLVWVWGQFPVGYFFNEFLQSIMGFGVILILLMLPLSVISAYARDLQSTLTEEIDPSS